MRPHDTLQLAAAHETAARYNRNCRCATLDEAALDAALQAESGDPEFYLRLIETRPHLYSKTPVFLPKADLMQMHAIVRAVESVAKLPSYRERVEAWAPAIAKATIGDLIPLPLTAGVEWRPLALAAVFGLLVTIAFTMWPLARTRHVPASALFRHHVQTFTGWPGLGALITIAVVSFGGAVKGLFQGSCDSIKAGTQSSASCGP